MSYFSFSSGRNTLPCSSEWTRRLFPKKSYAMSSPCRSSVTALDLLCKLSPFNLLSPLFSLLFNYFCRSLAVVHSTRGGFVALSPVSPQEMFVQQLPSSRQEKEEDEDEDYHSPYHPYRHRLHYHQHMHTLVSSYKSWIPVQN